MPSIAAICGGVSQVLDIGRLPRRKPTARPKRITDQRHHRRRNTALAGKSLRLRQRAVLKKPLNAPRLDTEHFGDLTGAVDAFCHRPSSLRDVVHDAAY